MKPHGFKDREKERQSRESNELAQRVRAERNMKMEKITGSRDGRDVIASILIRCGVFDDIRVNSSDIYRHSGMRAVGLWLRDWIMDANFDNYVTILRELKEDARTPGKSKSGR